ncbi:hypothetical protein BJX99DRAFT_253281 [Aspergillus californicus]
MPDSEVKIPGVPCTCEPEMPQCIMCKVYNFLEAAIRDLKETKTTMAQPWATRPGSPKPIEKMTTRAQTRKDAENPPVSWEERNVVKEFNILTGQLHFKVLAMIKNAEVGDPAELECFTTYRRRASKRILALIADVEDEDTKKELVCDLQNILEVAKALAK